MTVDQARLDQLCINTIRMLAVDAVETAKSGHPGMPMGTAPLAYVLWTRFLKHHPRNPAWPDRDRFVLSAGHGSMLLYSLLHLSGYDLPLEELKRFRQWGSRTPGHPEHGRTPGVETTTGPLGQGFANGVGMAIAEQFLAERFNRPGHTLVDHYTYAIVSDGDLMEGVASEAASLAGHLRLGKLIYLYDDNGISIDGPTDLTFTENVGRRFEAYGWHVQEVEDGNDLQAIEGAIHTAQAESARPSLIIVHTHIAYGSPHKQDTAEAHGAPLGAEEVNLTKAFFGWPQDPPLSIPDAALAHFRQAVDRGHAGEQAWQARLRAYARAYPELADEWQRGMRRELPPAWEAALPVFKAEDGAMATRVASGRVLNAIAPQIPNLIGGSADLAASNNTLLRGGGEFSHQNRAGRNLYFGVREHGMGSILNGLALHGGVIAYGATFLIFSDYMRPAIRLAALTELPVIYVFTHDSVALGEDGPTHQPIEHLASLRAMPQLTLIRPADATETAVAWRVALQHTHGPVALVLTRQNLPILDRTHMGAADGLEQGAYILADADDGAPDIILIASGSEVALALEARKQLAHQGIRARVVSMPSWELFERQSPAYRDAVLPPSVTRRLAIEAGSPQGWCEYVGLGGDVIGLKRFGASAPGQVVMEQLGFTVANVVERALKLLERA
ncbi:MAG: transketolase [Nitrospinae bacterium]|nr:transketolase [Nitrospinota bacterium]